MIRELSTGHGIGELCVLFGVSRSGYYGWLRRDQRPRARANKALGKEIERIHRESRQIYGSPRITKVLHAEGIRCGHNRVARLMRERGLRGIQKHRYRPRTTDSRHEHPVSPNLVEELPRVGCSNQAWAADITYVPTKQGWTHLAVVLDLGTRLIKGWSVRDSLRTGLVSEAFLRAAFTHRPPPGLIHHSDRGGQYASKEFRAILEDHKALSSMGKTGNCYDNATVESFFATLKTELVRGKPFSSKEAARRALFECIEIFYNRQRLHSALGYRSPVAFETELLATSTTPHVSAISE